MTAANKSSRFDNTRFIKLTRGGFECTRRLVLSAALNGLSYSMSCNKWLREVEDGDDVRSGFIIAFHLIDVDRTRRRWVGPITRSFVVNLRNVKRLKSLGAYLRI